MPNPVDTSDTARLRLEAAAARRETPTPEDTADLGDDFLAAEQGSAAPDVQLRAYAEAILRFYRARTILDRDQSEASIDRAWAYLEMLEPSQVPAVARPAFFELAYFAQLQAQPEGFDHAGFRRRVQDVAIIIDGFLDGIFTNAID